jgi:uncharacterized protein (TIGR00369 family)
VTGESERGRPSERANRESERGGHIGDTDDGEVKRFSAATIDRMQGFVDEHGYLSWLGVELESAGPGRAVMTVPYHEELTNPSSRGVASTHGGIPATLIDTASGFALRTTFDDPARAALTTTDLDVSYLRPATNDLRVEAEVAHVGGTIGVTRASVTSVAPGDDRKEVAIGTATYRLFRDHDGDADNEGTSETGTGTGIGTETEITETREDENR